MIRVCTNNALAAEFSSAFAPELSSELIANPQDWLARYQGKKPLFACILSFTETGLLPAISAAGADSQARRYTALADGEYLYRGSHQRVTRGDRASFNQHYPLPPLTAGISPAVLTRAILTHCHIPLQLFSTGLPDVLPVPHIALSNVLAKSLNTGAAMTLRQAETLFASGFEQGQRLALSLFSSSTRNTKDSSYLVLGEAIVGGTTTAQAVLTALGYAVAGQVSSSHAVGNHSQKQSLVAQGLRRWQANRRNQTASQTASQTAATPLEAAAAVGDPMQLAAAGLFLAVSQRAGVLLAGGSQMLAVYALGRAIAHQKNIAWNPSEVVVGTTRWVIEDASANTVAIAQLIGAPYLASQLNFARSPYFQLRAYERGFVKEGTGLGGCAIAAHLYQQSTNDQLRHAIEAQLRQR